MAKTSYFKGKVILTKAQYDALVTKDPDVEYLVTDDDTYVADAPQDGRLYGRKDKEWVPSDFTAQDVAVVGGVATIPSLTDKVVYTFSTPVSTLSITGKADEWDSVISMALLCITWAAGTVSVSYGATGITAFDAAAPAAGMYAEITIFNNKAKIVNGN